MKKKITMYSVGESAFSRGTVGEGAYFYASEEEAAGAAAFGGNGEVFGYFLNRSSLNVLDLTKEENFFALVALFLKYCPLPTDSTSAMRARGYFLKNCLPDLSAYDIVRTFCPPALSAMVDEFIDSEVSAETFKKSLYSGGGETYVLLNRKAVKKLKKISEKKVYGASAAYEAFSYKKMAEYMKHKASSTENENYVSDIIKEGK